MRMQRLGAVACAAAWLCLPVLGVEPQKKGKRASSEEAAEGGGVTPGGKVTYRQEYTDKQKKMMAEIAQKPEVQREIEGRWADLRGEHLEEAYDTNAGRKGTIVYPNPIVNDYVNELGQKLVPENSPNLYTFRLLLDPRPRAHGLSTGTIYVSTGLVSMLDNEAQLSYVLAHEVAHVERNHFYEAVRNDVLEDKLAEAEQQSRQKRKSIFGAIGAVAGAATGGLVKGGDAALTGAALGLLAGNVVGGLTAGPRVRDTAWDIVQEDEADAMGVELMLARRFDPREVPKTYARLENLVGKDSRVGLSFMGDKNRSLERTAHIQRLLAGALSGKIEEALRSGGLIGGTPEFAILLSALKRDNGVEALQWDLFGMARENLEDAAKLRSNDPRVHYYLGKVLAQTARSDDERKAASNAFLTAIRYDAQRGTFPEPYLQHALNLIKQNDPSNQGEIATALKSYVLLYQRQNAGALPPNMYIVYDYFLLAGEASWSIPPFQFVSTEHFPGPGATQAVPVAAKANPKR